MTLLQLSRTVHYFCIHATYPYFNTQASALVTHIQIMWMRVADIKGRNSETEKQNMMIRLKERKEGKSVRRVERVLQR